MKPAVRALMCAILVALPVAGNAAELTGRHSATQGVVYVIDGVDLEYATDHPQHPPLASVAAFEYALAPAGDGFVGPRRGADNVWFTLPEVANLGPMGLYASGLRELIEQVVRVYEELGLIGVYVAPDPNDIDPRTGEDLRPPERTGLRLVIETGRVEALRTFAAPPGGGQRGETDGGPHRRIRNASPLQPVSAGGRSQGDLLLRAEIERYAARVSRHPGRRVDVSFAPAATDAGVYLDYMVAEDRPWTFYSQWSDTGTKQTTENRQQFGFTHTQLTGRDDILRLGYVTGDFDDVNAGFGSYEMPFFGRTRLRMSGSWSDYDASQFGFAGQKFEGTQWAAATEVIFNLYQRGDFFLDLTGGARWMDVEVTNLSNPTGSENFFVPKLGLAMERLRATSTFTAGLSVERNLDSLAGTSSKESELFLLGRSQVDEDWMLMRWSAAYSMYLEPLFNGAAWRYSRTPSSSTLAHEIALRTAGQYAFDSRLIPQTEFVLGGFNSVRGYPEATIASDSGVLVSAEYRYHWPRSFMPAQPSRAPLIGEFRVAPQRVYGRPDWDLVLRVFSDWGRATFSDSLPGEDDETLFSIGAGLELILWRNMSLRLDYGSALSDVRRVESGDGETHVQATVRY